MEVKKLVILLWLVFVFYDNVFGGIILESEVSRDGNVAKFIGEIVRDASVKDSSRSYDVALVCLKCDGNNDLFNEILAEIPEDTLRLIPDYKKRIDNDKIGITSFNIIISDVTRGVCFFITLFCL